MPYASKADKAVRHREYMRQRYNSDPVHKLKQLARAHADRAVKRGVIEKQPCEVCGKPNAEKHHDDYSKPLEVRWLCGECHRAAHGSNNFNGGPAPSKSAARKADASKTTAAK